MRRRRDDWINATHILKAAGFDKVSQTLPNQTPFSLRAGYMLNSGVVPAVADTYP